MALEGKNSKVVILLQLSLSTFSIFLWRGLFFSSHEPNKPWHDRDFCTNVRKGHDMTMWERVGLQTDQIQPFQHQLYDPFCTTYSAQLYLPQGQVCCDFITQTFYTPERAKPQVCNPALLPENIVECCLVLHIRIVFWQ